MADESEPQRSSGGVWPLVVAGAILLIGLVGAPLAMLQGIAALQTIQDQVEQALLKAEFLELYSLDGRKELPPSEGFHGFAILGKVELAEPADREAAVREFLFGVHENTGMSAPCFTPKFGLRVRSGGRTFDLVVSFECLLVKVYEGEKSGGSLRVSVTPQPYFVELLKGAGVSTAPAK